MDFADHDFDDFCQYEGYPEDHRVTGFGIMKVHFNLLTVQKSFHVINCESQCAKLEVPAI